MITRVQIYEFHRLAQIAAVLTDSVSVSTSDYCPFDPEFQLTVLEGPDLLRQFGSVSVPATAPGEMTMCARCTVP